MSWLSGDGASVIGIGCLKADSGQSVDKEGPERGAPLPNYPWKRGGGDTPVVESGIVDVIRRYLAALPSVGIHGRPILAIARRGGVGIEV